MKIINWCIFLLVLLASCAGPTGNTVDTNPIKIGSILILSGEGAAWGTAAKNGIDMAVEKINAEGGINGRLIEANHQDDKSDPALSVTAFQKLTQADGVQIIVGTTDRKSVV